MNIFNTMAETTFISLSFFMTGACFCWLTEFHRLRIKDLEVSPYDLIEWELPEYRRSVKVRERGLVLMGIVISAANCVFISVRPSVYITGTSMLAALLLQVLANRHLAYVHYVFLLSMYTHYTERLRRLQQY